MNQVPRGCLDVDSVVAGERTRRDDDREDAGIAVR